MARWPRCPHAVLSPPGSTAFLRAKMGGVWGDAAEGAGSGPAAARGRPAVQFTETWRAGLGTGGQPVPPARPGPRAGPRGPGALPAWSRRRLGGSAGVGKGEPARGCRSVLGRGAGGMATNPRLPPPVPCRAGNNCRNFSFTQCPDRTCRLNKRCEGRGLPCLCPGFQEGRILGGLPRDGALVPRPL